MAHLRVHLANRLRSTFHHDAERRLTLFGCPQSGAYKVSARLVKHGLSAEDGHEGDRNWCVTNAPGLAALMALSALLAETSPGSSQPRESLSPMRESRGDSPPLGRKVCSRTWPPLTSHSPPRSSVAGLLEPCVPMPFRNWSRHRYRGSTRDIHRHFHKEKQ